MSHEKNNNPKVVFDHLAYNSERENPKRGHHGKGEQRRDHNGDHKRNHKRHHHNNKLRKLKEYSEEQTSRLDFYLTHPVWGLLSFIFIIWLIFFFTFRLGAYPQAGIEHLMDLGAMFIRDNIDRKSVV